MNRLVFDTSVIVSALRSHVGASNSLLRMVARGYLTPLLTTTLFLEYESILKRPEHLLVTKFSEKDVDGFLSAFASSSEPVDVWFHWRPQLRDPNDEMVLEAAINGQADALVTHNTKDFLVAESQFNLLVIQPKELARLLKS